MSAMKHELDKLVEHSIETGWPVDDDVADALSAILLADNMTGDEVLSTYDEGDRWALALAIYRHYHEHRAAVLARDVEAGHTADGIGRLILLIVGALALAVVAIIGASIAPGTALSTVALLLAIVPAAYLIYRSLS